MLQPIKRLLVVLSCTAAFCLSGLAVARAADESVPSSEQIDAWVQQLGSEVFAVRERAAEMLREAGPEALDALTEAADGSNPEVADRAVRLLFRLSRAAESEQQAEDEAALDQSEAVLRRIAALDKRPAESGAARELLSTFERRRAILEIKRLGGEFESAVLRQPGSETDYQVLRLGAEWKGGDAGLDLVSKLRDLRLLRIHGAPVTDDGVTHLQGMNDLVRIELYGTDVTKEGVFRLQQALPTTTIEHRLGALLGVEGDITWQAQGGALIKAVREDTAAEKAGIQPGDLIVQYDGQPVPDFMTLTAFIAKRRPGDKATLGIVRGGKLLKVEVTFGRWK